MILRISVTAKQSSTRSQGKQVNIFILCKVSDLQENFDSSGSDFDSFVQARKFQLRSVTTLKVVKCLPRRKHRLSLKIFENKMQNLVFLKMWIEFLIVASYFCKWEPSMKSGGVTFYKLNKCSYPIWPYRIKDTRRLKLKYSSFQPPWAFILKIIIGNHQSVG